MVATLHSESRQPKLLIRADANTQMGNGHFMRCVALAQAWKDSGGAVQFATACTNEKLLKLLFKENFIVHQLGHSYQEKEDWQMTERLLAECPDAWLVLDGYHFSSDYQKQVKAAGYRLIVIDDMAGVSHYYADLVLNQNIHAQELRYSREPYTRLLLSPRYVLLRREFLGWRTWHREVPDIAHNVLVTVGGSDPGNVTLKIVQALQSLEAKSFEALVVVGNNNPHQELLQAAVRRGSLPIRLACDVSDMSTVMAWADVAVSSGGSSVWELSFMGVPILGLIRAEQESRLLNSCSKQGLAVSLGWYQSVTVREIAEKLMAVAHNKELRSAMAKAGRNQLDGFGPQRVVSCIREMN